MSKLNLTITILAFISCTLTTTAQNIQSYTNNQFGISFNYSTGVTVTEEQTSMRNDLGTEYKPPYIITVSVPFVTQYGEWTWKGITISIHDDSCNAFQGSKLTFEQKTINGTTYSYLDPEGGETSGMSSLIKEKKYYYQSKKCYQIIERISGLGNNERPRDATKPPDRNSFLNSELVALDEIIATLKIKQ